MKRLIYLILLMGVMLYSTKPLRADVCKIRCRVDGGVVCIERGPCEPMNEFLSRAARDCRQKGPETYVVITKGHFVDILSEVLRLDKEFTQDIKKLTDEERYELETTLLKDKGIDIFTGTDPAEPVLREELAELLKDVTVEEDMGYSSGLANQSFDLNNEGLLLYNTKVYVNEGNGPELWERKENFKESHADSRRYTVKLDSCNNARVVFGDNINGKVPIAGSRLKASYNFYGREDKIVTECETVMLFANRTLLKSLKNLYNPSRPLTRANFAELLMKAMHLGKNLPDDFHTLSEDELYRLQIRILASNGVDIYTEGDPAQLLTHEELASVLYNSPVEDVIGVSNGYANQGFELNNAGFMIYDLHTYVNEGVKYEEWNKRDNFMGSSSKSKDYVLKLDSGNYATIYFGDGKEGRIPAVNSPIKVNYRLYAPRTMLTEDDIICVLGKIKPVIEAYEPPMPPFEYPDPTDGFEDPASHF